MGEEETGMDPDVAFRMVFGRLSAIAHGEEFGNPNGEKA